MGPRQLLKVVEEWLCRIDKELIDKIQPLKQMMRVELTNLIVGSPIALEGKYLIAGAEIPFFNEIIQIADPQTLKLSFSMHPHRVYLVVIVKYYCEPFIEAIPVVCPVDESQFESLLGAPYTVDKVS